MKKRPSPYNPYREKAKGKETRPGSYGNPLRPRARTCGRYALAGAAADELINILGGSPERDRGTWAFYCYHFDLETILEKARECHSKWRQGEIRNPVTAFQKWLGQHYPKKKVKKSCRSFRELKRTL